MSRYVLALDQGTTSSRAILFDNEQNIIAVRQREFEQLYPQQGWVEHDPMEIWSSQYGVMNEVVAQSGVDAHDIAAIGITNQRETTILWEKATGRPIYNAIVWQCRRTAPLVDELLSQPGMAEYIKEHPESTLSCLNLVGVFRKLERSGDHINNIAEEIVFFIDAKVLKHSGKIDENYPNR